MNPITPITQYHNSSPSGRPEGANPHLTIVKVGGAVVEDTVQLERLLNDFAAIKGRKILVHGGGRRATQVASRLGIESRMIGGRRITDSDMLRHFPRLALPTVERRATVGQTHKISRLSHSGQSFSIYV